MPTPPSAAAAAAAAPARSLYLLFVSLSVLGIAISISLVDVKLPTLFKDGDEYIYPAPLLLPAPPPLVGVWAPDRALQRGVRRIGDGLLPKPEDVAVLDGEDAAELFVGCKDGWIRRVNTSSGAVHDWAHIPGGRPLGVVAGLDRELIVCDPNTGLLNVTEGKVELLSDEADGVKFKCTDAAVVARDGSIFFTDASHKYTFEHHVLDVLEARPYGRLLKYDPKTRSTSTILDRLYFANGVALSRDEDFLVFCETTLFRCQRYWLKGEKAGTVEGFLDNLPAFPDNIKHDGKGHFWIALTGIRSFYINELNKYPRVKNWVFMVASKILLPNMMKRALVVCVTEEGVPVLTLGDPSGKTIHFVTTALVVGDDLFLGSLGVDFLGHMKLNGTTRALPL